MSSTYENLSPNGHETMITKIFQKIKNLKYAQAETIAYADYQQLTPDQINEEKIRFCNDYPDGDSRMYYDAETKTLCFAQGVSYDSETKTVIF